VTAKRSPPAPRPDPAEVEIRDLAQQLRDRTRVLIGWHPRRGGGHVSGDTVLVRLPCEPTMRATSDAEVATLRAMELQGTILVWWPFNCWQKDGEHAPLRDDLEALARAL
jgi:hypothetical protein